MGRRARAKAWWLVVGLALSTCQWTKAPLVPVGASFSIADASWFEAEQTLFFFYTAQADQGIGPESVIEVTYTTDDVVLPWTDVSTLATVHTHVPVDCGPGTRCGSLSLKVEKLPRKVGLQLRYAKGGALVLDGNTVFNVVAAGNAATNRSLLVYGVFTEHNERVQWRERHVFPTIRNEQATQLGLRRALTVADERFGTLSEREQPGPDDPYGYALMPSCPSAFTATGAAQVATTERAVFSSADVPLAASSHTDVCATSTVTDATGTFTAMALARKNPETRPAFPSLRSPIRDDTPLKFLLAPCGRVISDAHLAMQKQRLLISDTDESICIDGFDDPGFEDTLVARLSARVDAERVKGADMVLSLALHHDDTTGRLAAKLEAALARVLGPEAIKSTPRAVGAFVLDSFGHALMTPGLERQVLWCPAKPGANSTAAHTCALQLPLPDLSLGPLTVGLPLPILPTRQQYLDFIATYSDAQAGEMKALSFRAPERTPASSDVALGDFGVGTFFNGELITTAPTDAFSYCPGATSPPAIFRVTATDPPAPLSALPQTHQLAPQPSYQLGLAWAFPYLLKLDYTSVIAGKLTAFSLAVPFGVATDSTAFEGFDLWSKDTFPLADVLAQCRRFCDEPTFDSAGVYQVLAPFRLTYQTLCYRPVFPKLGDGGFPSDP